MNRPISIAMKCCAGFLLSALALTGCDWVDITKVENPVTTQDDLDASLAEGLVNPTAAFLHGTKDRFADATENVAYFMDVVSDNYNNVSTYVSPAADMPEYIRPNDLTLNDNPPFPRSPYWSVQELRAQADFTIEEIYPEDANASAGQLAELYFYRGMANLMGGENFTAMPVEEDSPAIASADLIDMAIADLELATETDPSGALATRVQIALARAWRAAGDPDAAQTAALAAISGSSDFLFSAEYDENNTSWPYYLLVGRYQQDLQPLPRLDFLDPKYIKKEDPIPAIKMEEAYLILAEVELSRGNGTAAADYLAQAITLANNRETEDFVDNDGNKVLPPDTEIKFDPDSEPVSGLIADRSGVIDVPQVSASHLDPDAVAVMSDLEEIFYTLYLARQEIFCMEGRRMADLGIKLPMSQREIEQNDRIHFGDPGTEVVVPAYIPAGDGMDAYEVGEDGVVTIQYDMNKVIQENRISPFAMPF